MGLSELHKRSILRELAERERRAASRGVAAVPTEAALEAAAVLKAKLFPQQMAFFFDKRGRFRVARCTRRAGKSTGDAIKILITLLCQPRAVCLYVAQTSSTAREVLWPVLKELVADYDLPFHFSETHLRLEHTASSGKALLKGADTVKDIEKLRGLKLKLAIIDESGALGANMEDLVMSVIGPSLRDEAGELLLNGTPGYFPAGLFYEASEGLRLNWVRHEWSLQDNPYLSAEAKDLDLICLEEGLTRDSPRFIREYLGKYAINTATQMFAFDPAAHTFECSGPQASPLKEKALTWMLGVDFGWTDETAIVAIGYSPWDSRVWVAESWSAPQQTSDDVAHQLQRFIAVYKPKRIVGDLGGGGGKATSGQIWQDYAIYIEPAEKTEKLRHIEFINAAFMRGDLLIARNSELAKELPYVLWNEKKTDAHGRAKDNQAMAMVYAWRQCQNLAGKRKKPAGFVDNDIHSQDKVKKKMFDDAFAELEAPALAWFLKI